MKCFICGGEAIGRLSSDLDIEGIPFCKEHKEDVQLAYYILINENEEEFNRFIKTFKEK